MEVGTNTSRMKAHILCWDWDANRVPRTSRSSMFIAIMLPLYKFASSSSSWVCGSHDGDEDDDDDDGDNDDDDDDDDESKYWRRWDIRIFFLGGACDLDFIDSFRMSCLWGFRAFGCRGAELRDQTTV